MFVLVFARAVEAAVQLLIAHYWCINKRDAAGVTSHASAKREMSPAANSECDECLLNPHEDQYLCRLN
jgi:hypothetical protein